MNLTLSRHEVRPDGIFGEIYYSDSHNHICITLEHAYQDEGSKYGFVPKIAPGVYTCKRGVHRLGEELKEIETFEIMDVPPFHGEPVDNCVIHPANYDFELNGCIAPGLGFGTRSDKGKMITHSKKAFKQLMSILQGLDEFTLTIEA